MPPMNNISKYILLLMLPILAAAFSTAGNPAAKAKINPAAKVSSAGHLQCPDPVRQKARYYYLEGLRKQMEEDPASAYEYYKRAAAIDPSYAEAASAYGTQRLAADIDTLQTRTELARSLSLMRPFVDRFPDEYNEALYYAYVAARIDSIKEAIRIFERTADRRPDLSSTLVHLSEAYMADGNIDKALDALSRYEVIEGHNPQITIKKISYHLARRDTVGALSEATSLVDYNPAEPAFRILKGNMYEMTGNPDSTFYYYSEAERLNPDYGAAKLALANYYRQQGDSVKYDAKTYEALLSEDFDLGQKVGMLEEYLQILLNDRQNTARGDHLFSVLREQYPHEPQVLDLAARYSAAKGNFDEACEEIGYAIDLAPSEEKYRGQLMTYQMAGDHPENAMTTYREMERHLTPSRNMMVLYASAAQMAEDYDTAIDAYRDIIRDMAPTLPLDTLLTPATIPASIQYDDLIRLSQIFTSIGDCFYGDKKLDQAFHAYDNALTLYPDNTLALNNYAYFLSENGGDLDRAAEMSLKSLDGENSTNPTYLDTYAWILHKKGDNAEARKYQASAIEEAAKEENEHSELYDHYGDILAAEGDNTEALKAYEKALELEPDNKDIAQKIKSLKNAKK